MLRSEKVQHFARDCVYFKGDRPCQPHLKRKMTCRCELYAPRSRKILIIAISNPADVVRSLALAARIKMDDPHCHLIYLTRYPELLDGYVDEILAYDVGNLLRLQMDQMDVLYNLDMDKRACSAANILSADLKKGFYLRKGACCPLDEDAHSFYIHALEPRSEQLSEKVNRIGAMFEICGIEYRREMPRLPATQEQPYWGEYEGRVVGLSALAESQRPADWEPMRWAKLADALAQAGWRTVLLGDSQADQFNQQIAGQCSADYHSPLSLSDYKSMIGQCDVVVGCSGLVSELTWALGREMVLLHDGREPQPNLDGVMSRCSIVASSAQEGISEILPDKVLEAVATRMAHRERLENRDSKEQKSIEAVSWNQVRSLTAAHRGRPS